MIVQMLSRFSTRLAIIQVKEDAIIVYPSVLSYIRVDVLIVFMPKALGVLHDGLMVVAITLSIVMVWPSYGRN